MEIKCINLGYVVADEKAKHVEGIFKKHAEWMSGFYSSKNDGESHIYARTLQEWRSRFLAAWPTLAGDEFDNRFKLMWELYLAYCEGGFRAGMIDVKQILLMHKTT